ncbi:MAG TPA: hypothetical protein PLH72_11730 [Vicinamibacterales bacterium]|nr:hypothetical protein [Vicinamibacterales bacterium]
MHAWLRLVLITVGVVGLAADAGRVGRQATGAAPSVQEDTVQAAYMKAHLGQVLVVHAAVIRGDLAAVGPAARALATLDDQQFPAGAPDQVKAMKAAAARAADATDALAAGRATAEMLTACGNCHRTVGTRPAVPARPRPEVGGVVGHMLEHQLAADQLLEGLVIPSDTLWRAGARALMVAPLNPRELPVDSEAGASWRPPRSGCTGSPPTPSRPRTRWRGPDSTGRCSPAAPTVTGCTQSCGGRSPGSDKGPLHSPSP